MRSMSFRRFAFASAPNWRSASSSSSSWTSASGSRPPGKPDTVRTSDFLSFAGIEPLELPAIPLAQHLAEKVHANTRSYGTAARPSTRPKDLIDILLIADSQTLEAAALREALRDTFEARAHQATSWKACRTHRPSGHRPTGASPRRLVARPTWQRPSIAPQPSSILCSPARRTANWGPSSQHVGRVRRHAVTSGRRSRQERSWSGFQRLLESPAKKLVVDVQGISAMGLTGRHLNRQWVGAVESLHANRTISPIAGPGLWLAGRLHRAVRHRA